MRLLALALASLLAPARARGQVAGGPDTITVQSGALALHALLWHPSGRGPFPAVLFNHGSYGSGDPLTPEEPAALGPVFARHGYVFLFLCRQGIGLSADQGTADGDLMARALAAHGQEGRNRVQLELLQTEELKEALAALVVLRALPQVDPHRVAVAGHSFGGSLTISWRHATRRFERQWYSPVRPTAGGSRPRSVRACLLPSAARRSRCSSFTPRMTTPPPLARRSPPRCVCLPGRAAAADELAVL